VLAAEHQFHMDSVSHMMVQKLIYLVTASALKEKALQDVKTDDKVTKVVMGATVMYIQQNGVFTHPTVSEIIFCFRDLSVKRCSESNHCFFLSDDHCKEAISEAGCNFRKINLERSSSFLLQVGCKALEKGIQ
jgi:hypothetical protein